ncbi:MAG: hybrid sensor histidine kinase/response regulator [Verrucomicrobiales bacterium]|nr:hybrid sensor histidine kinase/response regulator [Verrucomicrobiales bacterium]
MAVDFRQQTPRISTSMTTPDKHAFSPSEEQVNARYLSTLEQSRDTHSQIFARILPLQWIACVIIAATISPRTWDGIQSSIHPHLIAAIFLGAIISLYPSYLVWRKRRGTSTRYIIAIAQMLMSALIIHLFGGRIEAHFHIFASLALIAFYRDNKILFLSATIVFLDHVLRGVFWPQSVFGVDEQWPMLRAFEHTIWATLEVIVLAVSIRRSLKEMRGIAERQITLENAEKLLEKTVAERTRELRTSEKKARDRFENAVIGLYHCDTEGRLRSVNPEMARMLGYETSEEFLAEIKTIDQIDSSAPATDERWIDRVLSRRGYRQRDSLWRHKNGNTIPVRESTKVIASDGGTLLGIEGSVEDMTEFKELEQRYLQSQKVQALGQLTTGIAHDFNNILTSIVGFSELIISAPDTPENVRHQVKDIHTSAGHATRLTAQLLAFSRKQTFQPEAFLLTTKVNEMSNMISQLIGEEIQLKLHSTTEEAAYADPAQIQQVILNLAVNARDAMPDGGVLTLEIDTAHLDQDFISHCGTATAGHYTVLTVSDTGTGISDEEKERIFEPFFTTKGPASTGLGLATCIGIVKHSNGHITLSSEPGVGTIFRVYLPVAENKPQHTTTTTTQCSLAELNQDTWHGGGTILLAEDEEMARKLGVRALTSLGYEVVEAINGADALQKFLDRGGEDKFELVFTDVRMPIMGGVELAQRLKEISPNLPIIYSSGYTGEAITNTDQLSDSSYFLQKPYSIELLGKRITEALGIPAA